MGTPLVRGSLPWDEMGNEVPHLLYFPLTKEPGLSSEEDHSVEMGTEEGRSDVKEMEPQRHSTESGTLKGN